MLTRHKKLFLQRPMKHKLPKKPKNVAALKKLGVALLITIVAVFCYVKIQPHTLEAKQQIQLEHKSQQLKSTLHDLQTQKVNDATQQKKLEDLQKQLQDTQNQLEAKRNAATAYAAELPATPPTPVYVAPVAPVSSVVAGCGDNEYAQYIYSHESGCNLNAVNSIGCRGIGQACPGGKLPCGADYACQNAFFTNYAVTRYGSWAGAYDFWVNNHWW